MQIKILFLFKSFLQKFIFSQILFKIANILVLYMS